MMRYLAAPGRATRVWTAARWVVIGFTLCACATKAPSPAPTLAPEEPEASMPEAPAPEPPPSLTREEKIEQWLEQADRALANDRLLSPLADNAHDRYRAVLLYDPDNTRAVSGLQAIALRYLDLARSAAARSALTQARGYLELAEMVDPGNPLVEELRQSLQAQRERMASAEALTEEGKTISLNPLLLSQRADSLVAELHALAQRVEESGDFVLIVSRTDAEGRWIYQQMRDGVSEYLLRGDIKLGSPPRIQLQSPP